MSKEPLQLAIIGCGGMAQGHLRGYQQVHEKEPDRFRLVAMCDPVRERAEEFAARTEVWQGTRPRVYTEVEALLQAEDLDGADIVTPHHLHHLVGVACLEAGVNVLIEKPIGVTVKATQAIIEAARRRGKIAATAENIRRGPCQRAAHWGLNTAQFIGEPRLFFAQHAGYHLPDPEHPWHWRVDKFFGGGGLVLDSGAHFCDTIRYLYGEVDTVYAQVTQWEEHPHLKEGRVVPDAREDTWVATLTFESGLVGVWSWTGVARAHSFTNLVTYGSKGALVDYGDVFHGPFGKAEWKLADGTVKPMREVIDEFLGSLSEEERQRLFPYGFTDGVVLEVYDFIDALATERPPEIDAEEGLKAKAIGEAIYESAYCGQAVKVADVISGQVEGYQREINERWGL
ncbi:MAG TPA: Gfo/Idh/MocA family oxidoreductase [Armatimonadetes bacterium]|nr:Gfo/Idh/MocA family oxidoreductase [Armatimonadota bacterium]